MKIVESTNGIHFDPEKHVYTNSSGEKYVSGTSFIGLFKPKFDTDFWSVFKGYEEGFSEIECSYQQLNEYNQWRKQVGWRGADKIDLWKYLKTYNNVFADKEETKQVVLDMCKAFALKHGTEVVSKQGMLDKWHLKSAEALEKGSAYHDGEEEMLRMKYNYTHDWNNIDLSYPNLTRGKYPELRLYNHEYKIAGSADLIEVSGDKGTFDIEDYKTSAKIDYDSWLNPWTNQKSMMKYPIEDLADCNYIHYTLQLSLYAWMMEELGYTPNRLFIRHVMIDKGRVVKRFKSIETNYLRKAIIKMLKHYAETTLKAD